MRIAITGAAGKLGRQVVADLLDHDHDVVALDRVGGEVASRPVVEWDGRDVDGLSAQISGCSALIHLAAIPAPYQHPHQEVFGNNTTATFAALQAAADAGITAAAIASSGSAYGTAFSPTVTVPRYVPVDEDHPLEAADPYALSKDVDERTAAMFCRRYGMSIAALRFHWVTTRREQLDSVTALRSGGPMDEGRIRGLWSYIDIRDAARACRLAVEVGLRDRFGCVAMNIVAADLLSDVPLTDLIAAYAPDVEIRGDAAGPAYAIDRAEQVIGWRPRHSWRDAEPSAQ